MQRDDIGNKIGDALKEIRLSKAEKFALRNAVMSKINSSTQKSSRPVPSPFAFSFFHLRTAIASILLFFIVSGSGISYAAGNALPGDLLYAIKIGFNESIQVALATSPEEKATLAVSFADQRLEEAGKLAALGKLTPELEQTVSTEFENQANQVNAHLTVLESTDQTATQEISDQFEAVLSAHEVVLSRLALKVQNDTTNIATDTPSDIAMVTEKIHSQVSKLAERHLAYAESVAVSGDTRTIQMQKMSVKSVPAPEATSEAAPMTLAVDASTSASSTISSDADLAVSIRLYEKANTMFINAQSLLADASISDASVVKAKKELSAIQNLLGKAKTAIDAKDASGARQFAREALRRSTAFGVYLNAEGYNGGFSDSDDDADESENATTSIRTLPETTTVSATTSSKEGKKWFFGLPR